MGNFMKKEVFTSVSSLKTITINNGIESTVNTYIEGNLSALLCASDNINVIYNVPNTLEAPVKKDNIIGNCQIFINDSLFAELPVQLSNSVERIDFRYCLNAIFERFLFCKTQS